MTDRKTVMSWLEGLTWDDWHEYHSDSEVQNIAKATLELLKAQEPRVLTWDELMALPHGEETNVPVVSESKYPVWKWDQGTLCKWRGAEFLQELVLDHAFYNRESYNRIWRVWTALPTKEQREAVKWE